MKKFIFGQVATVSCCSWRWVTVRPFLLVLLVPDFWRTCFLWVLTMGGGGAGVLDVSWGCGPSTLGWSYETSLKASCCHRRGQRHSKLHVVSEPWCWIPLTNCLMYVCPNVRERLGTILRASTRVYASTRHDKGRICFYFVSPCLYLSLCVEASRFRL